ncbi:MAG: hypothetical protein K8S23_07410, partial [Candidatus Cloacimonetes bacterium]|nr:hypothetical protein [Candidatus Cloacimonadota bacterium]
MKTKKSFQPIILIVYFIFTIFTNIYAEDNKNVTYIPGELKVPSETYTFYVGESIELPDPEIDTPKWTQTTSREDPECSPNIPPGGVGGAGLYTGSGKYFVQRYGNGDFEADRIGTYERTFKATATAPGLPDLIAYGKQTIIIREPLRKYSVGQGRIRLGSINVEINLGSFDIYGNNSFLRIKEDELKPVLFSPKALKYNTKHKNIEVIKKNGIIRQIKSPGILTDIVVLNKFSYQIRFYNIADKKLKKKHDLYIPIGETIKTWTLETPDKSKKNFRKFRITEKVEDFERISEYSYDEKNNELKLTTGNGERIEICREKENEEAKNTIKTFTVQNSKGEIASKKIEIYHTFSWGESLIKKIIDPDGSELTKEYTYYEKRNDEGRYAKINTISYPNDAWMIYDYDRFGRKMKIIKPWKDIVLFEATEDNAKVVYNNYTPVDPADFGVLKNGTPRTIIETIEGIISKKTFNVIKRSKGDCFEIVEKCLHQNAEYGDKTNLRTTKKYDSDSMKEEDLISIISPDGKMDSYKSEKGKIIYGVSGEKPIFEKGKGDCTKLTIIHGTIKYPKGISFKTTKDISIFDVSGNKILENTFVFADEKNYESISWNLTEYNDYNLPVKIEYSNGTIEEYKWEAGLNSVIIDAVGIETRFEYDKLDRVISKTKIGIEANSEFPKQADVSQIYTYDAEGRELSETIRSGNLQLSSTKKYDLAGRIIKETNREGLITAYSYEKGGRDQETILPGGATNITERYIDGSVKRNYGTGIIAGFHEYGINKDGTKWTKDYMGTSDSNSERWNKTTSDLLGKMIKTEKPGFIDIVTNNSIYNDKGQLIKIKSCCAGETIYEYDELGNNTRSGPDVNQNGKLDPASMDRITDYETLYEKIDNIWWRKSTSQIYPEDNNPDPLITNISKMRLTGFSNGISQEMQITDLYGNITIHETIINSENKSRKTKIKYPDSDNAVVNVEINELLFNNLTKENLMYKYRYDALGRQTAIIDPRIGTSKINHNGEGQISASIDAAGNKTEYFYHPQTGLLIKTKDPLGQFSYTSYTPKGEIYRKWGAGDYPVQYKYDDFGNMIELQTFRGDK